MLLYAIDEFNSIKAVFVNSIFFLLSLLRIPFESIVVREKSSCNS